MRHKPMPAAQTKPNSKLLLNVRQVVKHINPDAAHMYVNLLPLFLLNQSQKGREANEQT